MVQLSHKYLRPLYPYYEVKCVSTRPSDAYIIYDVSEKDGAIPTSFFKFRALLFLERHSDDAGAYPKG